MYVYININIYIYTYIHVCIHTYIYIHIYMAPQKNMWLLVSLREEGFPRLRDEDGQLGPLVYTTSGEKRFFEFGNLRPGRFGGPVRGVPGRGIDGVLPAVPKFPSRFYCHIETIRPSIEAAENKALYLEVQRTWNLALALLRS